jgi:hypothetical protein
MPTPEKICNQVIQLTIDLIKLSLCNNQNFPALREKAGRVKEIGFSNDDDLSIVLKNLPYQQIYDELDRVQAYNFKMLDGALIQILYTFKDNDLISHRLAFFPSPNLEKYQNNPEIYDNDEIYADIIRKNVVPFPVRFDYNVSENTDYSLSHMTLGQYKNCRIPVTAPLTPYYFVSFVLRNFYNTAFNMYCRKIRCFEDAFPDTIATGERGIVHIQLPIS